MRLRYQRQHVLLQIKHPFLDTFHDTFPMHQPVQVLVKDLLAVAGAIDVEIHA